MTAFLDLGSVALDRGLPGPQGRPCKTASSTGTACFELLCHAEKLESVQASPETSSTPLPRRLSQSQSRLRLASAQGIHGPGEPWRGARDGGSPEKGTREHVVNEPKKSRCGTTVEGFQWKQQRRSEKLHRICGSVPFSAGLCSPSSRANPESDQQLLDPC